jgi:hypothetical protein
LNPSYLIQQDLAFTLYIFILAGMQKLISKVTNMACHSSGSLLLASQRSGHGFIPNQSYVICDWINGIFAGFH